MLKNQLYTISEFLLVDADKFEIDIHIDPNHSIFEGHFPKQPILPGVCLIEIIRELITEINLQTVQLIQAQNIKFLKVVDPGLDSKLKIKLDHIESGRKRLVNATSFLKDGSANFKLKAEYSLC